MNDYLTRERLNVTQFAELIGVSPQAAHRYVKKERKPRNDVMQRIIRVTKGAVTPNDIYGLPDTLTEEGN